MFYHGGSGGAGANGVRSEFQPGAGPAKPTLLQAFFTPMCKFNFEKIVVANT